MKRLLRILGKIGKIGLRAAPVVGQIAFPQLTSILETVFTATAQAESLIPGPGRGQEKRAHALAAGALVVQVIAPMIEQQTGREIDEEQLLEIYGQAADLVVKFHNLIGTFPKGAE